MRSGVMEKRWNEFGYARNGCYIQFVLTTRYSEDELIRMNLKSYGLMDYLYVLPRLGCWTWVGSGNLEVNFPSKYRSLYRETFQSYQTVKKSHTTYLQTNMIYVKTYIIIFEFGRFL
jgi:hypothetical protein